MNFDIREIPFSRFGSYLMLSRDPKNPDDPAIYLRSAYDINPAETGKVLRILLYKNDKPLFVEPFAEPWRLLLKTGEGNTEIFFIDEYTFAVRTHKVDLQFEFLNRVLYHIRPTSLSYRCLDWKSKLFVTLSSTGGELKLSGEKPLKFIFSGDELLVEVNHEERKPRLKSSSDLIKKAEEEYKEWQGRIPSVPDIYRSTAELAWYILWSAAVSPLGYFHRPGILSSKNWMCGVWSWDHCFNALGVLSADPELAWNQFMLSFDVQCASGKLADVVTPGGIQFALTKPPIHGWCLRVLMEREIVDKDRLKSIYEPLSLWTRWWLEHRDDDRDGVCQYNHGCESGWDNSTTFDGGVPVDSPDLNAYLILQMDVLGDAASRLGKRTEAGLWKEGSHKMLNRLIERCWKKKQFISPRTGSQRYESSDSLINFMPLVLGELLRSEYFEPLVEGLQEEGRFLTTYGLATESLKSPCYESNGYWRGPIWAPSTFLIVDGLRRRGKLALAQKLSESFCNMVNGKEGIYENYDASTGEGYCDPAFTWTSSVFLLMASELLQQKKNLDAD